MSRRVRWNAEAYRKYGALAPEYLRAKSIVYMGASFVLTGALLAIMDVPTVGFILMVVGVILLAFGVVMFHQFFRKHSRIQEQLQQARNAPAALPQSRVISFLPQGYYPDHPPPYSSLPEANLQSPPYPPHPGTNQPQPIPEQPPPYPSQPGTNILQQPPPYPSQPGNNLPQQPPSYPSQPETNQPQPIPEQPPPYPSQPGTNQPHPTLEQPPPYPSQPGTNQSQPIPEQPPPYPSQPGTNQPQPTPEQPPPYPSQPETSLPQSTPQQPPPYPSQPESSNSTQPLYPQYTPQTEINPPLATASDLNMYPPPAGPYPLQLGFNHSPPIQHQATPNNPASSGF